MSTIKIKKLDPKALIPRYQTAGSAGFDLCALEGSEIASGERALIRTGLAAEIPNGYELQVRPRSSIALRHGVTIANAPGTVDSDYRGELMIILINLGKETFTITAGDRIAQAVLKAVEQATIVEVDVLGETERGAGGFGSTGR
ncbi:deoxyuridine 5'-triphosphate nucleotidohydrolase [Campylobacterota bacterium]|nr:deoxyuridine 5'-triphosphate nucleotidohydrolase [Campylobacterota bacterium]